MHIAEIQPWLSSLEADAWGQRAAELVRAGTTLEQALDSSEPPELRERSPELRKEIRLWAHAQAVCHVELDGSFRAD